MIEKLTKFDELEDYTKNSNLNYRDAIISYYKTLGENLGFTVRGNPSVIKHGINFGRINMI